MCLKKTFHVRPSSSGQYAGVLVRGFKGFLRAWLEKICCWPVPWFSTFDFGRCFTISFQQEFFATIVHSDFAFLLYHSCLIDGNANALAAWPMTSSWWRKLFAGEQLLQWQGCRSLGGEFRKPVASLLSFWVDFEFFDVSQWLIHVTFTFFHAC